MAVQRNGYGVNRFSQPEAEQELRGSAALTRR
jgi:hypothetical protein